MNEAKPIVTCHGNQSLFSSLHSSVAHGLPKEACEWRRSYGRAPRSVHLEASFVPYDADILPDDEEKTLVSRPYFHIFWTDCDLDAYKQSVRDDIAEWQSALKARNIPDWLIVVVTADESKMKAKLLPRASVIDKIKSDFCGKYPDRCIILTEPNKKDSKDSRSSESWSQLFQRLRTLLLQAFNRHLNKYEESMRSRREKRNEPGWNYFSYFIFQEELAFMLEMLGLKEDALIQYDELDAMFDQFVENFANGDTVRWLAPLIEPCNSWAGVSLLKSLDLDQRDEIKQNNASLLSFRNYLFARQAALLFQMSRAWEVSQRAMNYLYNTVVEVNALEIEAPEGALSCWVFLSCLEVLKGCELHNKSQLDEKFALFTANLWDLAHKKLQELGHLCSLMPGLQPTSAQLSLVVDLVAGMSGAAETLSPTGETPVDKLRESLSSPESFKRHYLDMCEQAMGTYKYIGRYRSARLIGMELADFYMKIKEPQKAEGFLMDSIRMYQQEGWTHLADGTMLQLASCQSMLDQPSKYLMTACHIACSEYVQQNDRDKYFQETIQTLDKISEQRLEVRASQAIFVEDIALSAISVSLADPLTLVVDLLSNFPQPLTFDLIQVSIVRCSESEAVAFMQEQQQRQQQQQQQKQHRRQSSGTHFVVDKITNFQPVKKQLPCQIDCRANAEKRQGRLISAGIACDSAHELLKRSDSAPNAPSSSIIMKGDYTLCFSLSNVTLHPGVNTLTFSTQMMETGVFKLDQMCFSVKSMDLLKPLIGLDTHFKVLSIMPEFSLKPKHTDKFVAGVEQESVLLFTAGSHAVPENSIVSFTTSPTFSISPVEGVGEITLGPLKPHQSCEILIQVYLGLKKEMAQTQQCRANMTVESVQNALEVSIEFVHPFQVTHQLYTAGTQKYFQLTIHGNTNTDLYLHAPELTAPDCRDIQLHLINRPDQIWPLSQFQSVSFLWKLDMNVPLLPALDVTFTCNYSSVKDLSSHSDCFSYSCSIQDFQTQYIVSYSVASIEEDKSCTTGESAILDISVEHVGDLDLFHDGRLAYSVKANGTVWAIGGKSSGVFKLKDGKHNVVLDVVPMRSGYLHFPLVTLYKYLDPADDGISQEDTEDHSFDSDSAPLKPKPSSKDQRTYSSSSLTHSCLVPFPQGQVYNKSRNRQIHVYPCRSSGDIDVSLVV